MAGSCPLEPERRKTLKVSPFKITAQKILKWDYVDFARRFDIFFFLQMKKVPLLISAHSFITLPCLEWLLAHGGSPRSLDTWHAHHGKWSVFI